jgi:acetoin utilization protein AcuB
MEAPFSTILCAVDLDDNSLTAAGVAAKVAWQTGARLIVLHVVPTQSAPSPKRDLDIFLAQEREARKFLEEFARERLRDVPFEVMTRSGDPEVGILHVAEELQADLLVMATHTRGKPLHQFVGSVAEKVLRQSSRPVLMVPAAAGGNIDMVEAWMTAKPVAITSTSTLAKASERMRTGGFRSLPVVDGGRLVGVVTDRDVRNHLGELEDVEVNQAMTAEVVTVTPTTSIQEAARLLLECKIGGLPVVDAGRIAGVITVEDVIKYMLGRQ